MINRLFLALFLIVSLSNSMDIRDEVVKGMCKERPFYENGHLVCRCKKLPFKTELRYIDDATISVQNPIKGHFNSPSQAEVVVQAVGCEPHFEIDRGYLIPLNWGGLLMSKWKDHRWKPIYYGKGAYDRCQKFRGSRGLDELVCIQRYENNGYRLEKLVHIAFRGKEAIKRVIYSSDNKRGNSRVSKWKLQRVRGDLILSIQNGRSYYRYIYSDGIFKKANSHSTAPVYKKSHNNHKLALYKNKVYRFYLRYPTNWFKIYSHIDKDRGVILRSKDHRGKLRVWGRFDTLGLRERYHKAIKNLQNRDFIVSYRRFTHRWFVVSGYNNYTKEIIYKRVYKVGNRVVGYKLKYPINQKYRYDRIIKSLSKNFGWY